MMYANGDKVNKEVITVADQSSSLPHRYRTAAELLERQQASVDDRSVLLDRRISHSQPGADNTGSLPDDLAAAALKARPAYDEWGSTAPSPMTGETARDYSLRVISELKKHSKHADSRLRALADLDDPAFNQIFDEVIADALEAGRTWAPPGALRARQVERADGSTMTEFVGDSLACWGQFMRPAQAVRRIRIRGVEITPNRGFVGKVAL
jgi:hypothetical protein